MRKLTTVSYWSSTIVLALVLLSGGIADLARIPATAQGVLDLGCPPMFLTILGTWKVLGAAALLAPRLPRLKEWAYAGSLFNFSGAVISHLVAGSAAFHVIVTGLLTIVTVISWLLRPRTGSSAHSPYPVSGSGPSPHHQRPWPPPARSPTTRVIRQPSHCRDGWVRLS